MLSCADSWSRGYSTGCNGTESECINQALGLVWFVGYIVIFFAVLGNRPAKEVPTFPQVLGFWFASCVGGLVVFAALSEWFHLSVTSARVAAWLASYALFYMLIRPRTES